MSEIGFAFEQNLRCLSRGNYEELEIKGLSEIGFAL